MTPRPKPEHESRNSETPESSFRDSTAVGYAIWLVPNGGKAPRVKPLKGIAPGAGVLERLARYLNALGRDVEIVVKRKPSSRRKSRLKVEVAG